MAETERKGTVAVVVVGDLGRSPRMQYHSLSLANNGFNVQLVGYLENRCREEVENHPNITIRPMKAPEIPGLLQKSFVTRSAYKILVQIFSLLLILFTIPKLQIVIVQTPPAIPILTIAHFVCFCRRCKLVIDWHNLGYTILALSKGRKSSTVKIYRWYERIFGRGAYANFCVTKAMKDELNTGEWGHIQAKVMYDKPPKFFRRADLAERHDLFLRLSPLLQDVPRHFYPSSSKGAEVTPFTIKHQGEVQLPRDRCALLVSSTSWGTDEDFSILIDALKKYDQAAESATNKFPNVILIVTGKGPEKEKYEAIMRDMNSTLRHVYMTTMYLEPEDYPRLLGSADLGISLHFSSSALDLPMKVVDMFGCQLPVCAINFRCLDELVHAGENGLIFENTDQLAQQIQDLLGGFSNDDTPRAAPSLDSMRDELRSYRSNQWEQNWNSVALPVFESAVFKRQKKVQ